MLTCGKCDDRTASDDPITNVESTQIGYGGEVPSELYFKDTISPPDSELQTLTLSRGSQVTIPVVAQKPMVELK